MAGTYANCQVVSGSLGFHRNSVFSGLLRQANIFNGQKPKQLGNSPAPPWEGRKAGQKPKDDVALKQVASPYHTSSTS